MSTFPEPDMSVSASALHLLLARHREIVDLPLEWRIDRQGVVSPFLPVNDEQCEQAAQLLAAALELTVELFEYQHEGVPMRSYRVEGRWGGAPWWFVAYTVVQPEPGVLA